MSSVDLLLHAKKKYAAINLAEVDGKYIDKLEVKGLDMKRREYCALSKEASQRLLNEILSGDDPESRTRENPRISSRAFGQDEGRNNTGTEICHLHSKSSFSFDERAQSLHI